MRGVAEQALGGLAEGLDRPPLVDDDHRVGHRQQNRAEARLLGLELLRQTAKSLLARAQCNFAGRQSFVGASKLSKHPLLLLREILGLMLLMLQPRDLRDVLHSMDDPSNVIEGVEDRVVSRAPMPLLEYTVGAPHVIFLHRHDVGLLELPHPVQRGCQVADPARFRVRRVIREDLEQVAPHDLITSGHGGGQIGIARPDDG